MGHLAHYRSVVASAVIAVVMVAQPAAARQSAASAPAETESAAKARARLVERIVDMLSDVATNARSISDPSLRLNCELQAAALLWPRNPDRAREVYADAFDALVPSASATTDERVRAAKLQGTLLAAVARHDPPLAERFVARLFALPADDAPGDASGARAEILATAAIEMLPDDPARAAALGRVALGDQVTPAFMRLLVVLRGVDVARADALFGAAVAVQARTVSPRIVDVQMLGSYIGANGDAQLTGASVDTVRAFLESAFRAVVQAPLDSPDATNAYFLGRQLFPAYARYLPERVAELDARITLLSRSTGFQAVAVPAADRSAESADAVHARAASTAIDRDDFTTVHAEAAAIEDEDLRSRVYAQAALHLIKLRRLGEAAREVARVPDRARRATLLVQLARAAYSSGDVAYAVQTLGEAEAEAARSDTPAARLQALFSVTSAFVEVDPMRAFDSMKGAIENVNRASRAVGPAAPVNPASLNFDATLARLARLDFDRALLLADQIDARGHRLLAEISVCRGGLAAAGVEAAVEELDDEEPVAAL